MLYYAFMQLLLPHQLFPLQMFSTEIQIVSKLFLSLYRGDEYSIYWVFARFVFLNSLPVPNVYYYVVAYHMQLQFIAKYKKSHLVTRKNITSHNLSWKLTVLAISTQVEKFIGIVTGFPNHKEGLNIICTVKLCKVTTSTILRRCLFLLRRLCLWPPDPYIAGKLKVSAF